MRPTIKIENHFNLFGEVLCGECKTLFNPKFENSAPQLFCKNNHIFCQECCSILQRCPECGSAKLKSPLALSTSKLDEIEEKITNLKLKLPLIQNTEIEYLDREYETGAFADVHRCKWHSNVVALKRVRCKATKAQMEILEREAAIGFQLQHPNIVHIFGITKIRGNYLGIVMEWSDLGTLADHMDDMTEEDKLRSSLCICEGLGPKI